MSPVIAPLVRRAILDLMADVGGEQNHSVLTLLLNDLGHRVAERDVRAELLWLADAKLIVIEELAHYTTARILTDGRDVADGRYHVDGVSRHKTGE
jgi:hypothetical protein